MKCSYNKCNKEIPENKRKGSKFCSVNCKCNNRKMKKYWADRRELGIQESLIKIENYKKMMQILQKGE